MCCIRKIRIELGLNSEYKFRVGVPIKFRFKPGRQNLDKVLSHFQWSPSAYISLVERGYIIGFQNQLILMSSRPLIRSLWLLAMETTSIIIPFYFQGGRGGHHKVKHTHTIVLYNLCTHTISCNNKVTVKSSHQCNTTLHKRSF